jgi:hypothetical protein
MKAVQYKKREATMRKAMAVMVLLVGNAAWADAGKQPTDSLPSDQWFHQSVEARRAEVAEMKAYYDITVRTAAKLGLIRPISDVSMSHDDINAVVHATLDKFVENRSEENRTAYVQALGMLAARRMDIAAAKMALAQTRATSSSGGLEAAGVLDMQILPSQLHGIPNSEIGRLREATTTIAVLAPNEANTRAAQGVMFEVMNRAEEEAFGAKKGASGQGPMTDLPPELHGQNAGMFGESVGHCQPQGAQKPQATWKLPTQEMPTGVEGKNG